MLCQTPLGVTAMIGRDHDVGRSCVPGCSTPSGITATIGYVDTVKRRTVRTSFARALAHVGVGHPNDDRDRSEQIVVVADFG